MTNEAAAARTQRLTAELEARRVAAANAIRDFQHTLTSSDNVDELIRAQESVDGAKARLIAIENTQREVRHHGEAAQLGVDYQPSPGSAGRLEAARRFTKSGS